MAKREVIAELRKALADFESASVPGGGGEIVALSTCSKWERMFWQAKSTLTPKMVASFEARSARALQNCLSLSPF